MRTQATRNGSRWSRPDSRPLMVSILGTAWLILCSFGAIRGTLLVSGLSEGVEIGSHDPNEELMASHPEWVDPSWIEHQRMRAEREDLARRLGWPLLALSLVGIAGGVQLLRRGRLSRSLVLISGTAVIGLGMASAYAFTRLSLSAGEDLTLPAAIPRVFWATAGLNVAIQSIPVVVGLGLLRHPAIRTWVHATRGKSFEGS